MSWANETSASETLATDATDDDVAEPPVLAGLEACGAPQAAKSTTSALDAVIANGRVFMGS